ncbi:MAG: nucleoside recognition domain-containing protein [Enterovibrio sp.]
MSSNTSSDTKKTIISYCTLVFAVVFFSGLLKSNEWYGVFDFTTLNGSFGTLVHTVKHSATGAVETATTTMRGHGGSGATDGFLFALTLIPTVMFALGMINVLEHYGALDAARKLLSPLLKPLMNIPGTAGLALIASLQSTDAGAAMTRQLKDTKLLRQNEVNIFAMFQFSAGAAIVNFFSSGAVLFTLKLPDGTAAVSSSIGLAVAVIFVFKIIGANLFRIYLKVVDKDQSNNNLSAQG